MSGRFLGLGESPHPLVPVRGLLLTPAGPSADMQPSGPQQLSGLWSSALPTQFPALSPSCLLKSGILLGPFEDTLSRQEAAATRGSSRFFSSSLIIALDYVIASVLRTFVFLYFTCVSRGVFQVFYFICLSRQRLPLQDLKISDGGRTGRNDAPCDDGGGRDGDPHDWSE